MVRLISRARVSLLPTNRVAEAVPRPAIARCLKPVSYLGIFRDTIPKTARLVMWNIIPQKQGERMCWAACECRSVHQSRETDLKRQPSAFFFQRRFCSRPHGNDVCGWVVVGVACMYVCTKEPHPCVGPDWITPILHKAIVPWFMTIFTRNPQSSKLYADETRETRDEGIYLISSR